MVDEMWLLCSGPHAPYAPMSPCPNVPMSPPSCPLYTGLNFKVVRMVDEMWCLCSGPHAPMSLCPNVPMPLPLCPLNVKPQRCEGCPRVQCSSDPESHVQVNPKSSNWSPMFKWSRSQCRSDPGATRRWHPCKIWMIILSTHKKESSKKVKKKETSKERTKERKEGRREQRKNIDW